MKKQVAQATEYLVTFLPILFRLRAFLPDIQSHITDDVAALSGLPQIKPKRKHRFYEYIPSPNKRRAIEHFNDLNQLWENYLDPLYVSNEALKSTIDAYIAATNDADKASALRAVIERLLEDNDKLVMAISKLYRHLEKGKNSASTGTSLNPSRDSKGKDSPESYQRSMDEERSILTETGVKTEGDPSRNTSNDCIGGLNTGGLNRDLR